MRAQDLARRAQAFQTRKAEAARRQAPSDPVPRIDALTRIARNTWFAQLAALFFFGLTLMGFRHIDFFDATRAVTLPLVNTPVATRLFFFFAPAIVAASSCYLHLYLIRLWDALGEADPKHQGAPLARIITPWLVTDAALFLRRRLGGEDGHAVHGENERVERAAAIVNLLLTWGFGILVLQGAVLAVLPIRNPALTVATLGPLLVACFFGAASLRRLFEVIEARTRSGRAVSWMRNASVAFVTLAGASAVYAVLQLSPMTPPQLRAALDFSGQEIVPRPENWRGYAEARSAFRAEWCAREGVDPCADIPPDRAAAFEADWRASRQQTLLALEPPVVPQGLDLTAADLSQVFWPGADLFRARMEGADLRGARMERADLFGARMEGADLSGARMEGADLRAASFKSASWTGARIGAAPAHEADFSDARYLGLSLLDLVIGDDDTILPSGRHVLSCWEAPPPGFDALVERVASYEFRSADDFRAEWLCAEGESPRPVGRTAAEPPE